MLCSEEPEKHEHKVIRIVKEIEDLDKRWNDLRTDVITTNQKATELQVPFKNLIKMSETLMIAAPRKEVFKFKSLSKDLEELANLSQNFQKRWDKEISKMISKCELHNLLPLTEFYNATVQQLGPLKYLTGLDESMVWQFYRPALEYAFVNEHTWADTDDNTKAIILRLRFLWINSRVSSLEQAVQGGRAP